MSSAAEAARLLVEAERTGKFMERLPDAVNPKTLEQTYAIQDELTKLKGPVAGWKIGKGPPPTCAPMYAVEKPGAKLKASNYNSLAVETEFAFRPSRALPKRDKPYEMEDILQAVEMVPLFEVLSSRFIDRKAAPVLDQMADSNSNGFFTIGGPVANWRNMDLKAQRVELEIGGKLVQSELGPSSLKDCLALVVWMANHAAERTGGLKEGEIVTTGSVKGSFPIKSGEKVVGKWGDWAAMELFFA